MTPPCYSYNKYVLNTTMCKKNQTTNNINKTRDHLQTSRGKDKLNIIFMKVHHEPLSSSPVSLMWGLCYSFFNFLSSMLWCLMQPSVHHFWEWLKRQFFTLKIEHCFHESSFYRRSEDNSDTDCKIEKKLLWTMYL
jgi:hypothetical protein